MGISELGYKSRTRFLSTAFDGPGGLIRCTEFDNFNLEG